MAILLADGKRREATWMGRYLNQINAGSNWADSGWKCITHMYDPQTRSGLAGWPNALEALRDAWQLVYRHHRESHESRTAFHLGVAMHIVQDLLVPHHAAATALAGHKRFEHYAARYRHRYAAHSGGLYALADTPEGWAISNAAYARERYDSCLTDRPDPPALESAVADLLPRAQRTTAGFVAFALAEMGVR